ncbi:MAG: phosphohistidine phosphatase SixA [Candidatus Altimarinota bacterium]
MFRNTKKKQIIFIRHAKAFDIALWKGIDYDRPLVPAGEKSNVIMANYLRLIGLKPDKIVSSPDLRAKSTAIVLASKLGVEHIEYHDSLYSKQSPILRNPFEEHFKIIKMTPKSCRTLMVVGHNPDLTRVAQSLSGDDTPSMKKGSVIVLSLPDNMDWKDIRLGSLKFVYYLTPQFLSLEQLEG